MCRRVDCSKCGRPTFAGCGAHVERVLGNVPASERCRCREEKAKDVKPAVPAERRFWFRDLLDKMAVPDRKEG